MENHDEPNEGQPRIEPVGQLLLTYQPKCRIVGQSEEELEILVGDRSYTVTNFNLHRVGALAICLRLSGADNQGTSTFFLSEVNLARSRSRAQWASDAADWFSGDQMTYLHDLQALIGAMEGLQRQTAAREMEDGKAVPRVLIHSEDELRVARRWMAECDVVGEHLSQDLERLGYVGDEVGKMVLYLAATSRLLANPISVLSVANSSAGKSYAQQCIADLIPPCEVRSVTRLSAKALSCFGRHELRHHLLLVDEFVSTSEGGGQLRSLLSRGSLVTTLAGNMGRNGRRQVVNHEVLGPVALFSSATSEDVVDNEMRTRLLVLSLDESAAQTERVMASQVRRMTLGHLAVNGEQEAIRRRYQLGQNCLRRLPVVLPEEWQPHLRWSSTKLGAKRSFNAYLSLISAIALHRQYFRVIRRAQDGQEVVVAHPDDLRLANRLMACVYPHGTDSDLSPVHRRLLMDIESYCLGMVARSQDTSLAPTDVLFTQRDLREASGWAAEPARRGIEQLVALEYLSVAYGRQRGRFYRLVGERPAVAGSRFWEP